MSIQMYRSCEIGSRFGRFKSALILLACVVCCSLLGCGGGFDSQGALQKINATNAQRLSNLYWQYQNEHMGAGPKDEAEFRTYISNMNPRILTRVDIDPNSLDQLFTSERDSQPFTIRYAVKAGSPNDSQPIVFEQEGVDGSRVVAFTGSKVKEVDEAEYQQLLGN